MDRTRLAALRFQREKAQSVRLRTAPIALLAFAWSVSSGCAGPPNAAVEVTRDKEACEAGKDLIEFELEQVGVMGRTPTYTLTLNQVGNVVYHGTSAVLIEGTATGTVSPAAMCDLRRLFLDARFLELESSYFMPGSDMPVTTLVFRHGGQQNRVSHYWWGSRDVAPMGWNVDPSEYLVHEKLDVLADAINRAVGVDRWIGIQRRNQ